MSKKQYIVALEIGSSKVVGAVAEKIADNRLEVKHVEEVLQSNCVNYGIVQNVENIKSCIGTILRSIERVISGNVTQVFVGLAGRTLHSESSEINRSIDASQPITQAIIDNIIAEGSRNGIKRYETLKVVPRAFYVDKSLVTTNDPVGQYGNSIKIKFKMIVANSNIMLNLKRALSMTNTHNERNFIITLLAMGEHVLNPDEKRLGCMLVDMGAETTSVAIYKGGMLAYLNTIPLGGRNITLDIANGMNVLENNSERVKKNINNPLDVANVDNITIEGISSKEAALYINARAGEIIANVNKQLEYAGMTANEIPTIVLTGGAAQLKGIAKKVEETTKIKVRMANMPSNIFCHDCNNANRPEFVQLMALIAEAARTIDPMDSCITIHNYDDGPIITDQKQAPQPVVHNPEPKKPKGTSWWNRMKDRFESLGDKLTEDPDQ